MTTVSLVTIGGISVLLMGLSAVLYKLYLSTVHDNYSQYPHIPYSNLLEIGILTLFFVGLTVPVSYYLPIEEYPVYILVPLLIVLFVLIVVPAHSGLLRKKEKIVTQHAKQEAPETVEVDSNLKDARDGILEDN
jgi:hypothetical protein